MKDKATKSGPITTAHAHRGLTLIDDAPLPDASAEAELLSIEVAHDIEGALKFLAAHLRYVEADEVEEVRWKQLRDKTLAQLNEGTLALLVGSAFGTIKLVQRERGTRVHS